MITLPDSTLTALPKAELHVHTDGILSPTMAAAIRTADPSFPVAPTDLTPYLPVTDQASFWNWYNATRAIDGSLPHYQPIIIAYLDQLHAVNVTYVELMLAAGELPGTPANAIAALRPFRAALDAYTAGTGLQVEILIAFGRNKPLDRITITAEKILALYDAGLICGAALAGPELGWPVSRLSAIIHDLKATGMGLEIHAGEWAGPDAVRDALNHLPDRLGHAVSAFQDPTLLREVADRGIHLEFCPTSNLKTGSIRHLTEHPIATARELGLSFSLNTDDPGPFETTLLDEYRLARDHFGFTEPDFQRMHQATLAAAFAPRRKQPTP